MRVMRRSFFGKAVSVFILAMFVMTMNGSMGYAATPAIKMKHDILEYFVPEKRIMVQAEVTQGAAEVKLMRCYFRSTEYADYTFVEMKPEKGGVYKGILPAPSKETQMIEYLFLAADKNNQPVKTQLFGVKQANRETPAWQQVSAAGNIQVSTELTQAPASVSGFSDSVSMNVVESSTRFGVVAGGGFSLYTVLGVGAAALAAGGIIALGDGNGSEPPPPDTISEWKFQGKCVSGQDVPVKNLTVQINETKGGGVIGEDSGNSPDYQNGADVKMVLNGKFDAGTRTFSGNVVTTTTKLPYSCVRGDSIIPFSIPSGSNATGFQNTAEDSSSCGTPDLGCKMQIQLIRK